MARPGLVASYAYNGDGLRTSATTNGSTRQFTWDQVGSELLSDSANDYRTSMSRKANCWDNAVTETLWATIKRELTDGVAWSSKEELEAALFE